MSRAEILNIKWDKFIRPEQVMPKAERLTYITTGKEQVIFKMDVPLDLSSTPIALKLNWHTLTRKEIDASEVAGITSSEYSRLAKLYSPIPQLIPVEFQRIVTLASPLDHEQRKTLLTLQFPFITHPFSCVFTEIDENSLIEKAKKDASLRKDLIDFTEITAKGIQNGFAPDIDGDGNLVIVEKPTGPQLKFIDPHNIFSGDVLERMPRIRERLEYLKKVSQKLQG